MKDKKYEIGQRVQHLRYERGYTREALAERAGISSRFLADIETGLKGTSSYTIIRLAAAMRTSADFLLFGTKRREATIELPLNDITPEEQKRLEEILLKVVELFEEHSTQSGRAHTVKGK